MPGTSCSADAIFSRAADALPAGWETGQAFSGLDPEAAPFFVALLARAVARRCWVVCPGARSQEDFAGELVPWSPAAEVLPGLADPTVLGDPETEAAKLALLGRLADPDFRGPVVATIEQLAMQVRAPASVRAGLLRLAAGQPGEPSGHAARLAGAGYERAAQAGVRGQFSTRGGILDVFPVQATSPVRIEFDEDRIASIRTFDPDSQLSTASLDACEILLASDAADRSTVAGLMGADGFCIELGADSGVAGAVRVESGSGNLPGMFAMPFGELGAGDLVLDAARAGSFFAQLDTWRDAGWLVALAAGSEGERTRFREFAAERGRDVSWLGFLPLPLARGFVFPAAKLAVLADAALFGRALSLRASRAAGRAHRVAAARAALDFSEFREGDFVVHSDHGIGCFEGVGPSPENPAEEVLILRYAGDARLYVPFDQAWQVSRYAGLGRARPALHELGGAAWERTKQRATRSIFDYAARMLRLQAERDTLAGHAYGPDTHWQAEFEDAFPHEETPDQARAIADAKRDMEATRPMDRLICGDVGFGKTEVAIRAAFKAVLGGKQAAFLAPTTVLARQHFHTLRQRLSDYPVTIELLSRYRTAGEQRRVVAGLAAGSVDLVVGTHRLVSPDVVFRNLGLVVIDEEQRFGVRQKDLLKERFRQVDVLTLSATPIPRTLYLALSGARDMSLIETPPPNRKPIETTVCAYDERVWREAIRHELERGGQVYFLHNRVRTIEKVAERVRTLCPDARVVVGHGQMTEAELEPVMAAFVEGSADVLVSTTIVESGLDIPNANTIVIDRADLYGLADLYQLRGRVGRAAARAYAYLMLPRDLMGAARRRVSAIKQYSELGSGFKIAMRDLELRGAGNLLGTTQSGHIVAVGFDLYCRMLRRAVDAINGVARFSRRECPVRASFVDRTEVPGPGRQAACLPPGYVPEVAARIACYRQLAEASTEAEVDQVVREWRDRFGPLPNAADNAVLLARLSLAGAGRGLASIELKDGRLLLAKGSGGYVQEGGRFPRLTAADPTSTLREALAFVSRLP